MPGSLSIALLALTLNVVTYLDRRKQDRRDLFLTMHERLIDVQSQEGRRIIYDNCKTLDDITELRAKNGDAYKLANRSLALLDAFGIYVNRGYIARGEVFQEWGVSLVQFHEAADAFLQYRGSEYGGEAWPNFQRLAEAARVWRDEQVSSSP